MPVKPALALLASILAAACASPGAPPADRRPPVDVPASWSTEAPSGPLGGWLADLGTPALTRLVHEAVTRNFDLQSAASRVQAARAQARIAGADTLPRIQATAGASRSERATADAGIVDNPSNHFEVQGQVSWEADLWGRLSDESRATREEWQAAMADYDAARLSLAANVARRWFDVIAAQAQTRLARDTVESFSKSLDTIENRYRQGIGDALDVRLARNNLAAARANLAQRRRQQRNLTRALETLAGRYPAALAEPPDTLPDITSAVPAGLPAGLLERRPDLVAANARLNASGYRVAGADKNRLPGIALTASGGTSSNALRDLVDVDLLVWTVAASLTQPIFEGGRLAAQRDLARARDREALNDYASKALTAFREVEDALDSESYLADQEEASRTAAREARAAEELAEDQYRRGLTGIITLLESQRRKFNADSSLIDVANSRLQNRIDLYLALGGDFEDGSAARTALAE